MHGPITESLADLAREVADTGARVLRFLRSPAAAGMIGLALVVGVASGYGAVVFHWLILAARHTFFVLVGGALDCLGPYAVVLLPALGGLIVGPLVYLIAREARGHGVPEIMLAVAHQGGRIRPRVALVKGIAAAISIGSGGSAGQHGPAVQIGAGLGSALAQVLRLPAERVRLLVACGAAGGIAATFNAPIGGVLFALEIVLRNFTTRSFGIVVVSSVSAVVISHIYLGDTPAFPVPPYTLSSAWEFPLYLLLGLLGALVARAFVLLLYRAEDAFDALQIADWLKPAVGGLGVGILGVWFPEILGIGYEATDQALLGKMAAGLMVALVIAKIVGTSLTLGSGGSGGIFAPALFLGAMAGGAFGHLVHSIWPGVTAESGAYALVGMGAVFAAAARAPMTAIIILFEMTGDYRIIGPLMVASVVSTLMSEVLSRESIYTLKLARRGVDVLGAEPDLLDTIPAGKAMTTEFEVAQPDLPVRDLLGRFAAWDLTVLPVMGDAQKLLGIVTRWSVEEAMLRGEPDEDARGLMIPSPVSCSEEESLTLALHRLNAHDLAALPVVAEADRERLVGMLRRRDIIDAYQRERLERPEFAARLDHLRETAAGARMLEMVVEEGAPAAGEAVRALAVPAETLLVSVRRGQRTIIPRGDTVIRPGDRVLALAERDSFEALRRLFSRPA